jgi:hypothetical protein
MRSGLTIQHTETSDCPRSRPDPVTLFLKLDQKEMSRQLKVGQSQMSKIESGQSAPTLFQLIRIKKLAEEDDYPRENLTWEWMLEGKEGKGRAIIS